LKKNFDAVVWMRKRRIEIDNEDKGLSWEEKRKKMRKLLERDPLWLKLKNRVVEPSPGSPGASRKYNGEHSEKTI
jgi:hypothetical protein